MKPHRTVVMPTLRNRVHVRQRFQRPHLRRRHLRRKGLSLQSLSNQSNQTIKQSKRVEYSFARMGKNVINAIVACVTMKCFSPSFCVHSLLALMRHSHFCNLCSFYLPLNINSFCGFGSSFQQKTVNPSSAPLLIVTAFVSPSFITSFTHGQHSLPF